jgi:hypothetical protein
MSAGAAPTRVLLLGTDTAGTYAGVTAGTSQYVFPKGHELITFYFQSVGTTSGGTVLIEEADFDPATDKGYEGTWSQVASVSASTFTGTVMLAQHYGPNAWGAVRVRISSAITGGGNIIVSLRMV